MRKKAGIGVRRRNFIPLSGTNTKLQFEILPANRTNDTNGEEAKVCLFVPFVRFVGNQPSGAPG
jgi:hypothetical protein